MCWKPRTLPFSKRNFSRHNGCAYPEACAARSSRSMSKIAVQPASTNLQGEPLRVLFYQKRISFSDPGSERSGSRITGKAITATMPDRQSHRDRHPWRARKRMRLVPGRNHDDRSGQGGQSHRHRALDEIILNVWRKPFPSPHCGHNQADQC